MRFFVLLLLFLTHPSNVKASGQQAILIHSSHPLQRDGAGGAPRIPRLATRKAEAIDTASVSKIVLGYFSCRP